MRDERHNVRRVDVDPRELDEREFAEAEDQAERRDIERDEQRAERSNG